MIEIRLHGRGGQGVVTGAELIAIAAFFDGKFSQAFPYFGVERRGAPIEAYARIDDKFINLREQIIKPNIVIIQDASLLGTVDVLKGLKNNGIILINTGKNLKEIFNGIGEIYSAENCDDKTFFLKKDGVNFKVIAIDGSAVALKILGKSIVNTLMTLKLAKNTGIITLMSVKKALQQKFSGEILEKNLELAEEI
ncbi:MAG: 2-oxoacid:acceptor oxidoreductase family protein [bacterium]